MGIFDARSRNGRRAYARPRSTKSLKTRCYQRSSAGRAGNWVHRLTQLNRSGRSTVLLPPGAWPPKIRTEKARCDGERVADGSAAGTAGMSGSRSEKAARRLKI